MGSGVAGSNTSATTTANIAKYYPKLSMSRRRKKKKSLKELI
jgi:hypothetical protein